MSALWLWISGGFILGLFSAGHCFAMCGPLAVFLGTRLGGETISARKRLVLQLVMASGKAFTYAVIGLVFGFAGALLYDGMRWMKFSHLFPVLMSALLIFTGMSLLGLLPKFELRSRMFESKLIGFLGRRFTGNYFSGAFLTGLLWGFLPCPMVLVPALGAVVSGWEGGIPGAMRGFFMMLAFGAGTFPAILSSAFAGSLVRFNLSRWANSLAGMSLVFLGISGLFFLRVH
jgi:hypothetical protein